METKKTKVIITLLWIFMVCFVAIKAITLPPNVKRAKLVEISAGDTAEEIAGKLEDKGIIRRAGWFLYLTNRYGVQEKLQAGVYEFSGRTHLRKVISKIVAGDVSIVPVMIPEGLNVREIALILHRNGLADAEEFIRYAEYEKNMEGMLFPDTYLFPFKVSIEAIAGTMFRRFRNVFEDIYGEEITEDNFNKVKGIITVASIIEKEAMYNDEKPIIAGIIYRRLEKNMPIQSCATVIYALGTPRARLYNRDLRIDSPYNTYMHRGLPPGPIANPGRYSIEAALNPEMTDYLFFVARGDGRNHFSRTYQEHLEAARRFLSPDADSNDE